MPVRWRLSGRKIDCTVTNQSGWQVEELQIQVTVWASRRVQKTETCRLPVTIPVGQAATVDLPMELDPEPRQSVDCRVVSGRGFEAPANSRRR